MKKQLIYRVFLYFLGVIIFVLVIIFAGINFYIEDYYYSRKIDSMVSVANQVETVIESSISSKELLEQLEIIGYNFGGKISILDDYSVLTIYDQNVIYNKGKIIKEIKHKGEVAYIFESEGTGGVSTWLVYGKELNENRVVMLEIPVESIENSLQIVEGFFNYLVLISIAIASVFSFVLSRSISKPVIELNHIAEKIKKLDFTVRYEGDRKDEIGQLGETLNALTKKLQLTINDLTYELEKEKELDYFRKRFIAQVSHELQTPISVIKGYIEALEDGIVEDDEERGYYYSVIDGEVSKMSKIIRDLLDLSQLESGKFRMDNTIVNLSDLLDRLAGKYENIALYNNYLWQYKNDTVDLMMNIDEGRLEQALTNIISNAFKHVTEGGMIRFVVKKAEQSIVIIIENDGEQIEEEQLPRIWESFYKAKTSGKKKGTGLGLAIAANIFKYYHIKYTAYNHKTGVGFEVTIPLVDESL